MKKVEDYIRSIPDFPEKGIIFRDVTSVLQDADGLKLAIDEMVKLLDGVDCDVIAGTESRGFIFGMPIAYLLNKPFVLVRKAGKLPCETISKTYDLEYGSATIEIHKDAIQKGQKVVLVDDLIATGGTSDYRVAEEAAVTAEVLGNKVLRLYDVGVAGVHRLLANSQYLINANVVIAIAGMEGALASVVGGMVDCPVIAVPTSVGYGASFGGLSALLSMLNSCASGVSVVNIDNGFGAGYLASMINQRTSETV